LRIAFVSFEYPPNVQGGAGVYAFNITQELSKLGHDVVVFTPKIGEVDEEEQIAENLKIKRIKIDTIIPLKAFQFWLNLPGVFRKTENKFDVIHFNGISYWFLKKKISIAPHIVTIHHLVTDAIKNNNLSLISRIKDIRGENNLILPFIEKRCVNCADRIIAVSEYTKNRIIDEHSIMSSKISVIYNGIDLNGNSFSKEELEKVKEQFNIKKPTILFVGRIDDPRKNLNLLLENLKKVLEKIDAVLLIIGKGDQKDIRKNAKLLGISNNIIIAGFVDDITLKKCYKICDVYVCTSRLEGFGMTILEAMFAEKPIVATNVGAIPEIIGNYGTLVNLQDNDAISNAIINILSAKKNNKYIYNDMINRYSWNTATKKLLEIYGAFNE